MPRPTVIKLPPMQPQRSDRMIVRLFDVLGVVVFVVLAGSCLAIMLGG